MNDRLKRFLEEHLQPEGGDEYSKALVIQYATATLLIQVAKADSNLDELERAMINVLLQETFNMPDDMLDEVLKFANEATAEPDSVDEFIAMVNERFDHADKLMLIEYLWVVAFADGRLDHYEDIFIQKVAGLIQVSKDETLKAKAVAQAR